MSVIYQAHLQCYLEKRRNSDESRFPFFPVVAGWFEMRCAEMDECLVYQCTHYFLLASLRLCCLCVVFKWRLLFGVLTQV